jgi:hypothetical protein
VDTDAELSGSANAASTGRTSAFSDINTAHLQRTVAVARRRRERASGSRIKGHIRIDTSRATLIESVILFSSDRSVGRPGTKEVGR